MQASGQNFDYTDELDTTIWDFFENLQGESRRRDITRMEEYKQTLGVLMDQFKDDPLVRPRLEHLGKCLFMLDITSLSDYRNAIFASTFDVKLSLMAGLLESVEKRELCRYEVFYMLGVTPEHRLLQDKVQWLSQFQASVKQACRVPRVLSRIVYGR